MHFYSLETLPPIYSENIRLTPTSAYVLEHSHVRLQQLFSEKAQNNTESYFSNHTHRGRNNKEAQDSSKNYPATLNIDQQRRCKKLDILISLRNKILGLHHNIMQNNSHYHNCDPQDGVVFRDQTAKHHAQKHVEASSSNHKAKSVTALKGNYMSPDKVKLKKTAAKQNHQQDTNKTSLSQHKPITSHQKQSNTSSKQKQDYRVNNKGKKTQSIKSNHRYHDDKEAQLRHSQFIIMKIQEERERERLRQLEMEKVTGKEARRLEKIHMIERIEAQRQIELLRNRPFGDYL